jgi:hypothetical protein
MLGPAGDTTIRAISGAVAAAVPCGCCRARRARKTLIGSVVVIETILPFAADGVKAE